jgi:hypothetical protein
LDLDLDILERSIRLKHVGLEGPLCFYSRHSSYLSFDESCITITNNYPLELRFRLLHGLPQICFRLYFPSTGIGHCTASGSFQLSTRTATSHFQLIHKELFQVYWFFALLLLSSQNKLIADFEPGLTFYSVIRKHFGRYEAENGVFVTDMSITVAQPMAKLLTISHFLQPLPAAQFPLCSPPDASLCMGFELALQHSLDHTSPALSRVSYRGRLPA